jgi:hypothetical protein
VPTTIWIRPNLADWYNLETVDLSAVATVGIYVIWRSGQTPWTIQVGQGDIADLLSAHRHDPKLLAFSSPGGLRVTWAAVPETNRDGIERYLVDQLHPLVGARYPDVRPIPVNLPWAA